VTTGVLGASGTSGAELVRLLAEHPHADIRFATSRTEAGRFLDEIEPSAPPVRLVHPDDVDPSDAEAVFLCLPHGSAGTAAARCVRAGCRVIDLSGDHRLADPAAHAEAYGSERDAGLAARAVYGLTELCGDELTGARLVANPGCYATAAALALAPLAEAGLLGASALPVVDAMSGVSGAGRAASSRSHYCSASEDVRPYSGGRAHRHVPEIEQLLRRVDPSGTEHRVVFTPHLVPLNRGILATITVRGVREPDVRAALQRRYDGSVFVRVLPAGRDARIRGVAGTNRAHLAVTPADGADAVVVTGVIDNLLKGAAGQAVQNLNRIAGLPEAAGLPGARS
jgi:N-acetyl-gamma-glutamyl-phosphate reductase